jgi:hypothetical protein
MIKTLALHLVATISSAARDLAVSSKRSAEWPSVEKEFLRENGACAICGAKQRLQVHHKVPFHLRPELELQTSNLVTLCMSFSRECHLRIGHGGDFRAFNPSIEDMVEKAKGRALHFESLEVEARKCRRYTS